MSIMLEILKDEIDCLNKLKSKAKYDSSKLKITIEVEADDFNSSEEWNNFKEMIIHEER